MYKRQIEGLSYQMRQVALACGMAHPTILTHEEVGLLREQQYKLNDKGKPDSSPAYQRMLPNLLFSMRCYAKAHGGTFEPDTSVHGYGSMKKLIEIRNGLEHPKSAEGLNFDDDQLEHAMHAASWWKENMLKLFAVCQEADEYWKTQLA